MLRSIAAQELSIQHQTVAILLRIRTDHSYPECRVRPIHRWAEAANIQSGKWAHGRKVDP